MTDDELKIGEPTGEMTECDGWDIERDTECPNLVRVLHDPYKTAVIALCGECNASGEIYGPIDEPYWENEHTFDEECCADCKQRVADDIADDERYSAEWDAAAAAAELDRLAKEIPELPTTIWDRARYRLARFFGRV
jgi:hypothetical protein